MKIGIIGAGFTGLSAAYYLAQKGYDVTVFEKDEKPGGLAVGYRGKEWDWSLEKHYHHWFTNDKFILGLAKEIGHRVITRRPKTSVYVDGKIYQLARGAVVGRDSKEIIDLVGIQGGAKVAVGSQTKSTNCSSIRGIPKFRVPC